MLKDSLRNTRQLARRSDQGLSARQVPVCTHAKHERGCRLSSSTAASVAVRSTSQQQVAVRSSDAGPQARYSFASAQADPVMAAADIAEQQHIRTSSMSDVSFQRLPRAVQQSQSNSRSSLSNSSNQSRTGTVWHVHRHEHSVRNSNFADSIISRPSNGRQSNSKGRQVQSSSQPSIPIRQRTTTISYSSKEVEAEAGSGSSAADQQGPHHQDQASSASADVDFTLIDRLNSHAAASSSGRQHNTNCSIASSFASTSNNSFSSATLGSTEASSAAADAITATDWLYMQQGPAANFRDPRFEMAISRWIKEAPDWFKVRTVYERFHWRFNIINISCALSKLATLLEPLSAKRPMRQERDALRKFLHTLLAAAGDLLPSTDAGTAVAFLHSYSQLLPTRQVRRDPQLIAAVLEHIRPQLSTLKPNELAGLLWALKTMNHQAPADWLNDLYQQTQHIIPQLRADEVAVLLRGLAGAQAVSPNPKPSASSWLSAVLSHVEQYLEVMEIRHLGMLMLGLAYMQVRPSRGWMDIAVPVIKSRFDQMGPQGLSNILWSLAKLGCVPDRSWLNSYYSATLMLLNSMNATELSVDAWSLNKLRLEPSDKWLDEYFDESEAKLPRFSLQNLALCGYSLAKLGLRPPQTWLRCYCTLLLRLKTGLWKNKPLLTQVLVALDSFKVPRMDMWRRELYAAAGYKLYKYPNWRQRVKVAPSPAGPYSMWPYSSNSSRKRFGRRGLSRAGSGGLFGSMQQQGAAVVSRSAAVPVALRSGDWGVMDAMGGGRGVMGSMMSSYEELGPTGTSAAVGMEPSQRAAAVDATVGAANSIIGNSSNSSASGAGPVGAGMSAEAARNDGAANAAAGVGSLSTPGWSGSYRALPPRRPLSSAGLVRPPPPPPPAAAAPPSPTAAPPAAERSTVSTETGPDEAGLSDHDGTAEQQQH